MNAENYCVQCFRPTTKRNNKTNKFQVCFHCLKVWCNRCMAKMLHIDRVKMKKISSKGKAICPICKNTLVQFVLPTSQQLGFSQPPITGQSPAIVFEKTYSTEQKANKEKSNDKELENITYCGFCGNKIKKDSLICDYCGVKQ